MKACLLGPISIRVSYRRSQRVAGTVVGAGTGVDCRDNPQFVPHFSLKVVRTGSGETCGSTSRLCLRDHSHGIIKHRLLELGPDLTVEGEDCDLDL